MGWELLVRLQDYAALDLIVLGLVARDKQDLLEKLVEPLLRAGRVRDAGALMAELLKRESVMSTGIGGGIAIPHALTNDIEHLALVFGRARTPMDFQALDGLPVDLVFMLVGPKSASSVYVKLLARVSRVLQNEAFKERLRFATTPEEILEAFQAEAEYAQ
jgi:mannitol/fructose-specific phosphotransferase system IIA component (Ntr-type)